MEPEENAPEESVVADRINREFKVNLPGQNLPTPARFIAFFTLIGGFSIIGSLFVDIVRPTDEDISFFFIRVVAGVVAIATSYGIIEHKRWSIWLYGGFTLLALASNPLLSLIPLGVVIYLIFKREYFTPSPLDLAIFKVAENLKNRFGINKPPTGEMN